MTLAVRSLRRPGRPRRVGRSGAVVVAAVCALGALSGCAASDQSRTDACIVVAGGLEDVQEQIAAANTALSGGDLDAMGTELDAAAETLDALRPEVTNGDVAPILDALQTSIVSVRDAVGEAATTGDPAAATEALDASAGDLQNAALRFNDTCGS